jgi:Sec-independent protein translocase protein TatA
MNIFGVGGMEFALIIVIMLVVAGPKRMVKWMYILGKYTAKARAMWDETVSYLQKEFDDAGVDVQIPREIPTRNSINQGVKRQVNQTFKPLTQPVKEALNEVDQVKKATTSTINGRKPEAPPVPPPTEFGTWSGQPSQDDKPE